LAHAACSARLLTRGQFKQAADELQLTLTLSNDRLAESFASLFPGPAQQQLHQREQAHRSYRHAPDLYPQAQAPRFALRALAWREVRAKPLRKLFNTFVAALSCRREEMTVERDL
jgi:hypothetical protein